MDPDYMKGDDGRPAKNCSSPGWTGDRQGSDIEIGRTCPIKIAFVAHIGIGILNFSRRFARELNDIPGVTFYTVSSIDQYRSEIEELESCHIEIEAARYVNPLADLKYLLGLRKIIQTNKFDVVVTFGPKPNIFGALAAWSAHVPNIVVAVRGLGRPFVEPQGSKGRLLYWVIHRLYALSCRIASRVWFTNRNDRTYFISSGLVLENKTFMTKNSVDTDYFRMSNISEITLDRLRNELGVSKDDFVVIMVGRLVWTKGIREFAEAARVLKNRDYDVRFILVAPSEERSPDAVPESYVRDVERQGDLIWLGYRKDVRELYAISNLAVLPSYYKEGGYPRALLEPMALGKPVIAADTDDCRNPVEEGKNGYLVPPRDVTMLARRIEELFLDKDRCIRFGLHSLELVRREYDDRIVVQQVLSELGIEVMG